MNSKSKVFQGIVLVALSLTFIGYYFSLYRGYESNIAHYSRQIVVLACASMVLFGKKGKFDNRLLDGLTIVNAVLLVAWAVTEGVQILMI